MVTAEKEKNCKVDSKMCFFFFALVFMDLKSYHLNMAGWQFYIELTVKSQIENMISSLLLGI